MSPQSQIESLEKQQVVLSKSTNELAAQIRALEKLNPELKGLADLRETLKFSQERITEMVNVIQFLKIELAAAEETDLDEIRAAGW